jgi:RNA polymerase sigma factor (sigma-70 family)
VSGSARPAEVRVLPFVQPESGAASDVGLVERARRGDRHAFDVLYRLHVNRVYGVCLRMVADVPRAEQLTQDAFVLAWRRIGSFRGESAFTSWLHRLTVNVVLEDGRKRRRREAHEETVSDLLSVDRAARGARPDLRMALERAVAALPPGARTVLVLHDIEGYTHEEIAQLTGTAIGTTKAQLHRARRLLREMLGR